MVFNFLILSIFSLMSQTPINITGTTDESLQITGDCDLVASSIKSLKMFSSKIHNEDTCNSQQRRVNETICETSIKNCLPKKLAAITGKTRPLPGPNCYATALYSTNNYKTLRFVSEKEFSAIVKSRYCKPTQKPKPGSIGFFKSPTGEKTHAFTSIGENIVFERMGFDVGSEIYPFRLTTKANTFYKWEASSECRRWSNGSKECYNQHQYVDCDLTRFHKDMPKELSKLLINIENELDLIVRNTRPIKNHITTAWKILDQINLIVKKTTLSSDVGNIVAEQIKSIKDQLKFADNKSFEVLETNSSTTVSP
jgi:hypothetical protein